MRRGARAGVSRQQDAGELKRLRRAGAGKELSSAHNVVAKEAAVGAVVWRDAGGANSVDELNQASVILAPSACRWAPSAAAEPSTAVPFQLEGPRRQGGLQPPRTGPHAAGMLSHVLACRVKGQGDRIGQKQASSEMRSWQGLGGRAGGRGRTKRKRRKGVRCTAGQARLQPSVQATSWQAAMQAGSAGRFNVPIYLLVASNPCPPACGSSFSSLLPPS